MNKTKLTQISRYGGEEGYRAEMRRRRSLVKKPGLSGNSALARELANKRWKKDGHKKTTEDAAL